MRTLIGFLAGLATAYVALTIWHRLPGWPEDPAYLPLDEQPIDRGHGIGA